jgi:hypothetical protein
MVARFLGVRVWELSKVAVHYQDEAAIILIAQHEAKIHKRNKAIEGGAMSAEVILAEF